MSLNNKQEILDTWKQKITEIKELMNSIDPPPDPPPDPPKTDFMYRETKKLTNLILYPNQDISWHENAKLVLNQIQIIGEKCIELNFSEQVKDQKFIETDIEPIKQNADCEVPEFA